MTSLKRFVACASAVALAAGTTLAGAGVASAQEGEESSGSLSSSSLNLGQTVADLETAAQALNGPVTVSPNAEGGPTVTYLNGSEGDQRCLGFTAPYSTIIEKDLDTNYDPADLAAGLALITEIEAGGGLSHLLADSEGNPVSVPDDVEVENNVVQNVFPLVFGQPGESVLVEPGEEIVWTADSPETPALSVVICFRVDPETGALSDMETNFGIDPQVVADQINGKIPGGSVDIVGAGSISGGSVATGATVLGSLGSDGAGGDADTEEPPVETPAE
ncbi:hypothetical protein [Dietzia sp. ANT_WB102]|uniref:hypothetical protein n=1 Tax=Dietzia sp. ANT_WB102 TaxID=2597345 RepID=UPI0011EEEE6B|nr:hypothetical protein [Dietzia sp. ANT_WB102]KAA0918753.1 hypothetical protein FQ137_05365 [Dietzia sp. ANT_WB102]